MTVRAGPSVCREVASRDPRLGWLGAQLACEWGGWLGAEHANLQEAKTQGLAAEERDLGLGEEDPRRPPVARQGALGRSASAGLLPPRKAHEEPAPLRSRAPSGLRSQWV